MNRDEELKKLSIKLRKIRADREMSQEELADVCGFDRTYISMLERAKRNPSYLNLIKLAKGLNISVVDLFSETE